MISKITNDQVYEIVKTNDTVLILFFSPLDMASSLIIENLKVVDRKFGDKLTIVLVDIFEAKELVDKFKVHIVPTIIVYKEQNLTDKIYGYMPLDKIEYMLARYIKK